MEFCGTNETVFGQSVVFKQRYSFCFFHLHFLKNGKQSLVKTWDRLFLKVIQFQVPFVVPMLGDVFLSKTFVSSLIIVHYRVVIRDSTNQVT